MKTNIRKITIPIHTEISVSVFAYKLMTVPTTIEQHKAKKVKTVKFDCPTNFKGMTFVAYVNFTFPHKSKRFTFT